VNAEELGVTSANVDEMAASADNPNVKRLLGNRRRPSAKASAWATTGLQRSSRL
jgi:hypothetical protein